MPKKDLKQLLDQARRLGELYARRDKINHEIRALEAEIQQEEPLPPGRVRRSSPRGLQQAGLDTLNVFCGTADILNREEVLKRLQTRGAKYTTAAVFCTLKRLVAGGYLETDDKGEIYTRTTKAP